MAYWYDTCNNNPTSIGCKILSDNEEEETLREEAADTTKTAYAANEYGLFKTEANNTDVYYYRGGDHCCKTTLQQVHAQPQDISGKH